MKIRRPDRTRLLTTLVVAIVGLSVSETALSQITREEALAGIYPGAELSSERVFLTETQVARAEDLSGVDLPSRLVARYIARRDGETIGVAYVDTHVVRTKNESLLIGLDLDGRVLRVEVTSFLEPREYMASEAWYAQYAGRQLDDDLNLQRRIRPIAGASLTGIATTQAVRRVLAIDQALSEGER